jgi:hypothetical protein
MAPMGRPCKLIVIVVIVKEKITYYEVYLDGFEHSTLPYPTIRGITIEQL